jgi:ketopantoate reductase
VNPVTALLNCLNHHYSDSEWGQQMAAAVCQEVVNIYGPELLGVKSASDLADFVLQVISRSITAQLQTVRDMY